MNAPEAHDDDYERLADAMDAQPAGFTRTPNKLEIKLLRLVFTPEEALVASTMSRTLETAAEIAERVGLPEEKVTVLLESMIPRRMVRADTLALESGVKGLGKIEAKPGQAKAETVKRYRLQPFLVGWYESYLQEDKPDSTEFARTYEQYVIEGGGEKVFCPRPGPQGVIPYRGSLKPEWLKREPHNDVDAHFQRHDRFLVIDCVCKREKVYAHGKSCALPNKRCGFVGMPPAVPFSENVISREEAIKLWNELDAMGTMVVEGFYGFTMGAEEPQFVGGCHCCGCCCTILNAARLAPLDETIQRSNYRVVKDYRDLRVVRRVRQAVPVLRPHLRQGRRTHSRSTTVSSASAAAPAAWAARPSRSTSSPCPRRSGSTCRRASRSGRSGAWSSWKRPGTRRRAQGVRMTDPGKADDIFERLANALAELPHGFARTASGVEIQLIKKVFADDEVWLAGQLTRTPETAAAIANRVGRDEGEVTATLESLIPRRLVRSGFARDGGSRPGADRGGREEVPSRPLPGRLVRSDDAAPGQGVRRAVRAVRVEGGRRAHHRAAARGSSASSRCGAP